ncbi:MAG: SpoVR family protein [Deltaproteobacteria bacterium]|nr:SpoVR family protein [Deltaproteobacteria bacterium]
MSDYNKAPEELVEWNIKIEKIAREVGLDFFPVFFEVVDWKEMNMIAAYGGFPNRYPHWSFGMQYQELSKSYAYGLSKIYEMVINNNPCYAYLLHSNHLVDQKLVMAHVYGHCDFFKNNVYFSHTNRKMMDEMANHKIRVRRYIDQQGHDEVERFLDVCLSIENLIDNHGPFIKRRAEQEGRVLQEGEEAQPLVKKMKSKGYMDKFINPKEFLESEKKKIKKSQEQEREFPESPVRDVLLFLLEHAPMERWKRDILAMIRDEAYYFLPQMQTKIMNEGWASYWHSTLMTRRIMNSSEFIDYADHHSGTVASNGRLNPYKLGIELFRDIEDRWNKGRFGKEYEECDNMVEKKRWDKKTGIGKQKIFEVRKLYNDLTFIDTFLTEDFCRENKMFAFDYNKANNTYQITSTDFKKVKDKLLAQLTNSGRPMLSVVNGNYKNRSELYLKHQYEGFELKIDWLKEVLKNLHQIWTRPVYVETKFEDHEHVFGFDGKEHKDFRKEAQV